MKKPKIRKPKAQMKMHLTRDAENNKGFNSYLGQKKKIKLNVYNTHHPH